MCEKKECKCFLIKYSFGDYIRHEYMDYMVDEKDAEECFRRQHSSSVKIKSIEEIDLS